MQGAFPELAYLFSIAGLSVTLAGFSGLVSAFRRGAAWKPIDAYRLRQIPEMGLAAALIALVTIPLANATGSGPTGIRIASLLALAFSLGHMAVLFARTRKARLQQTGGTLAAVLVVDFAVLLTGVITALLGTPAAYEWLLVFLLARPMLAFVFVLSEISTE